MYGFSAQTWHLRVMVDFFPVWTQSLFVDMIGGSAKMYKAMHTIYQINYYLNIIFRHFDTIHLDNKVSRNMFFELCISIEFLCHNSLCMSRIKQNIPLDKRNCNKVLVFFHLGKQILTPQCSGCCFVWRY